MNTVAFFRENNRQLLALASLVIVFAILSMLSASFFSMGNVFNICNQASINLVVALGMTVVILSGGIDLSVGSLLAITIMVAGVLFNVWGVDIYAAFLIGIAACILFALLNGLVIQYGRVPPFIATLGAMGIVRGIVLLLARGNPTMAFPPEILIIADGTFLWIPFPIWIAAATTLAVWFFLNNTAGGRGIYAVGGNEEASRLSGLPIARIRISAYLISGICCAIAGIIFGARVGAPPPSSGVGYELSAIAAVIIGGTSLNGGEGSVMGTVIGALLMAVISNGLTILNVDPYWQSIVIGLIIVGAVMLANRKVV